MIETGLRDKVVIVTGAGQGIGAVTARRMAEAGKHGELRPARAAQRAAAVASRTSSWRISIITHGSRRPSP